MKALDCAAELVLRERRGALSRRIEWFSRLMSRCAPAPAGSLGTSFGTSIAKLPSGAGRARIQRLALRPRVGRADSSSRALRSHGIAKSFHGRRGSIRHDIRNGCERCIRDVDCRTYLACQAEILPAAHHELRLSIPRPRAGPQPLWVGSPTAALDTAPLFSA